MDYAALGLTELGNMSERRCARLVDADSNGGVLPMFLTANGGLESGLMMAQYTAAALASEKQGAGSPGQVDTIPPAPMWRITSAWARPLYMRQAGQILTTSKRLWALNYCWPHKGSIFFVTGRWA